MPLNTRQNCNDWTRKNMRVRGRDAFCPSRHGARQNAIV